MNPPPLSFSATAGLGRKPFPWAWIVALLLVATLAVLATAWFIDRSQDRERDRGRRPLATFIHASDPHLFLERSYEGGVEKDSTKRQWQERLDRAALREMLATAGNLPESERPEFILFTGDWGIDTSAARIGDADDTLQPRPAGETQPPAQQTDTTPATTDTTSAAAGASPPAGAPAPAGAAAADPRWTAQADTAAVILNTSPIKHIYWVPGNNDITGERGDLRSLGQADQFNTLVAQRLRNGVTIQNLTACFTGAGDCSVDVGDTRYTLVGVPTVSFKNNTKPPRTHADTAGNGAAQAAILARADTLVAGQSGRGRRVLLATHIPEMDDPYQRGQQLFAGAAPSRPQLGASAWNVSDSAFAAWKRMVESPGVAAVLAGHFHDSHREVYERPYAWAESSTLRADPGKLLLVPPLSVKNQEASPVQARGFALIRLYADSVDRRMFWMDAAGRFVEEARPSAPEGRALGARADEDDGEGMRPRWLWEVGKGLEGSGRMAIFLLGILIAFLTVAALWEVPEPRPTPQSTNGATTPTEGGTTAPATSPAPGAVFASNLGRTVLGGLTGIAGVALLQDVLGTGGNNSGKTFFLSVFITFFLWFLLASALLRGLIQALEARVTTPPSSPVMERVPRERLNRFLRWVRGFHRPTLVFLDTATSVLFGRGLRQTVIWESRFSDMQTSQLRTVNLARKGLSDAVGAALKGAGYPDVVAGVDYRVNVSLLSQSAAEAFYVATEDRSLDRVFGAGSLAFVAIHSGEARWWKSDYMAGPTRLRSSARLREHPSGVLPDLDTPLTSLAVLRRAGGQPVQVASAAVAVAGTHGDNTPVAASGQAQTVDDLLKFLNGATAFGGGSNPAVASLDRDGCLMVRAANAGVPLAITSLTLGGVELGPFTGNAGEVVLHRNDPRIFSDGPQPMMLSAYFETRSNPDYEAFMLIPLPARRRVEGSRERRGGLHISFRLAGQLDALWPKLDHPGTNVRTPDYDLHNRLLERTLLPNAELRATLAIAIEVLGEAIQQLNDLWLRDHARRP